MVTSRSDNIVPGNTVFYSDFTKSLRVHPSSGHLVRLTNSRSVRESIKNLVLTMRGERPYQPLVGGDLNRLLFEPIDDFTANDIRTAIVTTVRNNEPRVTSLQVDVVPDPDAEAYSVTVTFTIVNQADPEQLQIVLVRNR